VIAKETLEVGEIIVGLRYFSPDQPGRESFVKDLKALRQQLVDLTVDPETPATVGGAVKALDEAVTYP